MPTDSIASDTPVARMASPGPPRRESADAVPAVAVRGDTLFRRVDDALAWADGRLARWLPAELNPLAQAGAVANFMLLLAVVSGVALLIWYSPSLQFAHESLAALAGHTLGGWVRAVHRYSSDLAMLFLLMHAARTFFARKFAGARWLPWVSGVLMLGFVWVIGWTGYWLVWDQPAQHVARSSIRLLDAAPIFGEPLGRLFVSDRTVPSLLFFVVFFLHMLLPLTLAVGLAVHLMRISRARLLPRRGLGLALVAGLMLAALLVPAPLGAPARMQTNAATFTVDAWYLAPLALALRFQSAGLWLALGGAVGFASLIPWLFGRRRAPETYQAVVNPARCHACTQCVQDCPFDAIAMVARTDGRKFAAQAFVDPSRCVGCGVCAGSCDSEGIALTWFDTRVEEARLEQEIETALAGANARFAIFVAAEIRRDVPPLAGFAVHVVPTASWVRPKFLERLFARGLQGALVVRDARAESAARDGNRWVADRLLARRAPSLRPERCGGGTWAVVDFDPSAPQELVVAAVAFRRGQAAGVLPGRASRVSIAFSGIVLAFAIGVAAIAPSHLHVDNPASAAPELVVSLKAFGEREAAAAIDAATEAAKPVHMRGTSTQKPQRAAVVVRLTIDGVTTERTFRAKGISRDGPAIGEWRQHWAEGTHVVAVEIALGGEAVPLRWTGTIVAEPRRITVLSFDPATGFVVE